MESAHSCKAITWPQQGAAYGDANFMGVGYGLSAVVEDYDSVDYVSHDRSKSFTNKERTKPQDFELVWYLLNDDGESGYIGQLAGTPAYFPPPALNVESKQITIRLTVNDNASPVDRRDPSVSQDVTFTLNRRPRILDMNAFAADPTTGNILALSPVASGAAATDQVKARFTANLGIFDGWTLESVSWTMIPWPGAIFDQTDYLTSDPIPVDETHRRFTATLSVTWSNGSITHTDTKTKTFTLCFDKSGHDELLDDSRAQSSATPSPLPPDWPSNWPPNWFDDRLNHWGSGAIEPRMTEKDSSNNFIVHYAPSYQELTGFNTQGVAAVTDWRGEYAPAGHKNELAYRGRIYIFDLATQFSDFDPNQTAYGPVVSGIDRFYSIVYHEYAHRQLFLDSWGGFDDSHIRTTGTFPRWKPFEIEDNDIDGIKDTYEDLHRDDYHFDPDPDTGTLAVERWWTGLPVGDPALGEKDHEMYAYLWGEWNYPIGAYDANDWSAGGRQDY